MFLSALRIAARCANCRRNGTCGGPQHVILSPNLSRSPNTTGWTSDFAIPSEHVQVPHYATFVESMRDYAKLINESTHTYERVTEDRVVYGLPDCPQPSPTPSSPSRSPNPRHVTFCNHWSWLSKRPVVAVFACNTPWAAPTPPPCNLSLTVLAGIALQSFPFTNPNYWCQRDALGGRWGLSTYFAAACHPCSANCSP